MLKYCIEKWNENKDLLKRELETRYGLNLCEYLDLVKLVVRFILNGGETDEYQEWDESEITVINDSDYQGTLLFIFHKSTYQPSEYDYLMTYVDYGSCSGCDTLLSIQGFDNDLLTKLQVADFMKLCKDIVANIIKPYNCGWRNEEEFEAVKFKEGGAE